MIFVFYFIDCWTSCSSLVGKAYFMLKNFLFTWSSIHQPLSKPPLCVVSSFKQNFRISFSLQKASSSTLTYVVERTKSSAKFNAKFNNAYISSLSFSCLWLLIRRYQGQNWLVLVQLFNHLSNHISSLAKIKSSLLPPRQTIRHCWSSSWVLFYGQCFLSPNVPPRSEMLSMLLINLRNILCLA